MTTTNSADKYPPRVWYANGDCLWDKKSKNPLETGTADYEVAVIKLKEHQALTEEKDARIVELEAKVAEDAAAFKRIDAACAKQDSYLEKENVSLESKLAIAVEALEKIGPMIKRLGFPQTYEVKVCLEETAYGLVQEALQKIKGERGL